jgi:threonine synthase
LGFPHCGIKEKTMFKQNKEKNFSKNSKIRYYSTNHIAPIVPFEQALLKGQAPDRGLYMPCSIPELDDKTINGFKTLTYPDIAFLMMKSFLSGFMDQESLKSLCFSIYNFDVPLEQVTDRSFILRLDQGPTASFKDFGALFMGRLMQYALNRKNRNQIILTATSGDTGSAIANAFLGLDLMKVVVLFPKEEISQQQRQQMTTLGKNVSALAVEGKFDDCQALVKQAFADPDMKDYNLSSANSINIGRLLPQAVYYFYAYTKLVQNKESMIFSIPSGNFGNMMGAVFAAKMGLPVKKLIIATNENDEFPKFMQSGVYNKMVPSKLCPSSAMNVGHPSNLARLVDLYGGHMDERGNVIKMPDIKRMRKDLWAVSIDNTTTSETIREVYSKHRTLLEPHGAVGWVGLSRYMKENSDSSQDLFVTIETAHPAKFPEQIKKILHIDPETPLTLKGLENKTENYENISGFYGDFKQYIQDNFRG